MKNRKKAKGKLYELIEEPDGRAMGCPTCAGYNDSNLCVSLGKKCQAEEHKNKVWKEQ